MIRSRLQTWLYFPVKRFRRKRMQMFRETLRPTSETRILDVGGTHWLWLLTDVVGDVTLLNTGAPEEDYDLPPNLRYVVADGTSLPYEDGAFDICFSNSTIEHVHTWERQQAFAAEMRRVGRSIWLQTPAREFPVEPHWVAPFIHWLPKRWRRRLGRNFTVYGLVFRPSKARVSELVDEYRLLTYDELVQLFPDCEVWKERFLGLTKSYVVVRRA
jgi:Methyltransferase domain